jgi:FkbM family methyltransferase
MSDKSFLRNAGHLMHGFIAAVPLLARFYLILCRAVATGLSPLRRQQLLNSMATVRWPDSVLCPQSVLLGESTSVRMYPHNGEFDFAAVLGGRLRYEEEVFGFLDKRLKDYDLVIEIGANAGVFTIFMASKLAQSGGSVLSFEPSAQAYTRLVNNVSANDLQNVTLFNAAVSDMTAFAMFHEPEGHLTNGSLMKSFANQFSDRVKATPVLAIDAVKLNDLVKTGQRLLIKMDVEGFEAPVLQALKPVIEAHHPDILLEVLPEFAEQIEDSVKVAASNYRRYAVTSNGLVRQETLQAHKSRDCFLSLKDAP